MRYREIGAGSGEERVQFDNSAAPETTMAESVSLQPGLIIIRDILYGLTQTVESMMFATSI